MLPSGSDEPDAENAAGLPMVIEKSGPALATGAWLPLCEIVKVCPATLIVPLLGLEPGFAAAAYATTPLPLPLAPELIVIQPARLVATQLHAPGEFTPTLLLPPAEPYEALFAEREYVHVIPA